MVATSGLLFLLHSTTFIHVSGLFRGSKYALSTQRGINLYSCMSFTFVSQFIHTFIRFMFLLWILLSTKVCLTLNLWLFVMSIHKSIQISGWRNWKVSTFSLFFEHFFIIHLHKSNFDYYLLFFSSTNLIQCVNHWFELKFIRHTLGFFFINLITLLNRTVQVLTKKNGIFSTIFSSKFKFYCSHWFTSLVIMIKWTMW